MPGFFAAIDKVIQGEVRILIDRKSPDELWVTLLPSMSTSSGHLETPVCVSGTPDDLDAKLGDAIAEHLKVRDDLDKVYAAANKELAEQAAAKAATKAAGNTRQNTAKPVDQEPEKPVARSLTPAPKALEQSSIDVFGTTPGTAPTPPPVVEDEEEDGAGD